MKNEPDIVRELREKENNKRLSRITIKQSEEFYKEETNNSSNCQNNQSEIFIKSAVFEYAITANSISDENGIITHVNKAFLDLWGYEKKEAIGNPIYFFFEKPEEATPIIDSLNNIGRWEGEFIAKRKDKTTFIAKGLASVIRNEENHIIGYQSSCLDVTKQKNNEAELDKHKNHLEEIITNRTQELRDNKKFLQDIFNAVQSGISVVDKDLNIIRVNSWIEKTFSDKMPVVGKKCYEIYHNLNSPCDGCPSVEAFRTGEIVINEKKSALKNGGFCWYQISANPLKDTNGNVVNVIECLNDITEQKIAH